MNKLIPPLSPLLFFLLVLVFSCIRDYEPPGGGFDLRGEVVVNGILVQDSVPVIYLHRSVGTGSEGDFPLVNDASVTLYHRPLGVSGHGLVEEKLVFKDSCYKSDFVLLADHEYHLEVRLADGSLMEASTYIPNPHRIGSTRIVFPAGFAQMDFVSGPFSRIEVGMDIGELDQKAYFEIYNYGLDSLRSYQDTTGSRFDYMFFRTWNNDGLILREALPESGNYAFLFHLAPNDNPEVLLSFDFHIGPNPFFSEFYPVLNTVSEEYFLYKKSLYAHLESLNFSEQFDLPDLYMPSIFKILRPVYSNIRGGTGIFAGLSSDEMKTTCNLVGYACE